MLKFYAKIPLHYRENHCIWGTCLKKAQNWAYAQAPYRVKDVVGLIFFSVVLVRGD